MEAAWLAAMILVPVFFNIYSSRIFEPEKLALLRSLALVILASWIIKLIEDGGPRWETIQSQGSWLKTLLRLPLVAPVAALAGVYIISTVFSVTPQISLWGSYPRLQGAYTTFSYLIIFASMVANLRRRAQVERLLGAVILASLPVSLYGLLQRFQIDPIPWGGDVSVRIASNLGNSIFVAAYLIMVFPLTLMRIVESFEALVNEDGSALPNFVRATSYVFIAALQIIALYFSGSRGPWLGWGVSLVVIWLGLSLIWRKRWLTVTGVALAMLAAGFLITLNIPDGPLESLRTRPEFGRLGQLLDAESRTGKVRTLIWQGAVELILPHDPLSFPDGKIDALNPLRPLIGYGPEAMYVAYNRFYPPELAQVEKRNASPDRSHNETLDSLVMTGLLGLVVYLSLFGSVIYFGLKWLGLVRNARQRNLFLGLYLAGGAASSLVFVLWQGVAYLGVALPFGMILGVIVYLLLGSLAGWFEPVTTPQEKMRAYLLLGLVAAIMAHFMEINFGIAIAVTRAYFWTYAALIFLVGFLLAQRGEYQRRQVPVESAGIWDAAADQDSEQAALSKASSRVAGRKARSRGEQAVSASGRKKRRMPQAKTKTLGLPGFQPETLILGFVLAILLFTLGYDFITNAQRDNSVFQVIWTSFARLKSSSQNSLGVLALVFTTWLVGAALMVSETFQEKQGGEVGSTWLKMFAGVLAVSMAAAVVFWLLHAGGLVSLARTSATNISEVLDQVRKSENLLSVYYGFLFLILLCLAWLLASRRSARQLSRSAVSGIAAGGLLLAALALASYTNLRIVQADVAFKTAELFAQPKSWPVAIAIYNRANQLAPNEDYYYLFLGRAYLEHAKTISDAAESDSLISQAATDLRKAQEINPLNTDHTANLARLYSLWAANAKDPQTLNERARISEDYFAKALSLSPNHARLWDEWAMLYLNVLRQPEEAYVKLQTALEIDPFYDWTYALLGDYYGRYLAGGASDPVDKRAALEQAVEAYQKALQYLGEDNSQLRYSYAMALGSIEMQLGQVDQALKSFTLALSVAPQADQWRVFEALARLYAQSGDIQNGLQYAQNALASAPPEAQDRLRELLAKIAGEGQ